MGHQSLTSGMELRSNILVSGNADSTVKVWDIVTGQCLQTLSGNYFFFLKIICVRLLFVSMLIVFCVFVSLINWQFLRLRYVRSFKCNI